MKTQTVAEAIEILLYEAAKERNTKAGYCRVYRALNAIGLTGDEMSRIYYVLGYTNEKGQPYAWLQKKRS